MLLGTPVRRLGVTSVHTSKELAAASVQSKLGFLFWSLTFLVSTNVSNTALGRGGFSWASAAKWPSVSNTTPFSFLDAPSGMLGRMFLQSVRVCKMPSYGFIHCLEEEEEEEDASLSALLCLGAGTLWRCKAAHWRESAMKAVFCTFGNQIGR